jgi:putative hydrolase of the HAD superfamily
VQKAKPDPEIFWYAVEQLGVEPDRSIFVGDSIEKDYKGAQKAGLHPVLIVRNDAELPVSLSYITKLADVLEYLDF